MLSEVRKYIRSRLRDRNGYFEDEELIESLEPFIAAAQDAGIGLIITLGQQFPIFLVAENEGILRALNQTTRIRVHKRGGEWYISDQYENRLFSFDVPLELYRRYREQDDSRRRALEELAVDPRQANINMKNDVFKKIYVFYEYEGQHRLVNLELDEDWIASLEREIEEAE